jgi:hypothetical protein
MSRWSKRPACVSWLGKAVLDGRVVAARSPENVVDLAPCGAVAHGWRPHCGVRGPARLWPFRQACADRGPSAALEASRRARHLLAAMNSLGMTGLIS